MASPSTKQHHSPPQQQKEARLLGSQDLLTYYNLIPIYDKYVRPYPPPDRGASLDQTLQPYTADLPGKTTVEPDGFLFNLLRDPQVPENGPPIKPFDADVLREAYSLKPGPIPGFDASILGTNDGSSSGANTGQYLSAADKDVYGTSAGEGDTSGEKKHKKKKKKRKHSHEHEDDGHSHSEHKKKKKRKKQSSGDQQEQAHPM
ncbi:hypothetical protein O0I10_009287 [Lichtheimia ornata]|uniref:Mediator of RNA polymerase II transcription subunit 19 n=1 Tax=Lichtheimia ornata TaxID=688661 RepID=A0AAD7UYU8_9FUNG|nr:uncharacterized protein O0I10_009287 [Lichtheimia ornata]KAJ8655080.1 hypothetical protein O0I10_009287 [Lichtheimia ornata]